MDFSTPEQPARNWKVIIGGAAAAIVLIGAGIATVVVLRNRALTEVPVGPSEDGAPVASGGPSDTSGTGPGVQPSPGTNEPWPEVPPEAIKNPEPKPVAPGIERPLTEQEKKERGLDTNQTLWMRTSTPTDGSTPVVSFFVPPQFAPADADKDGLSDADEAKYGTDPKKKDTDDDGLNDNIEVMEAHEGFDPTKADSDGDGVMDGAEYQEHDVK